MFVVQFLSILILCILLFFVYWRRKIMLITKIPGPTGWPVVGNAWLFALPPDKLFSYLRHLSKIYEGIYNIYAINIQVVNIYNPDDIEIIMSNTRFNTKLLPYTFIKPWLCEGLLISNGEKWHQRRKLLTQAFHFNILKKYIKTFAESAEALVDRVAVDEGKTTDIFPLITETTLDVICETTMGTSNVRSSQYMFKKYFEALHGIGKILADRVSKAWLYFDIVFMFIGPYQKQKQIVNTLHDFTMSIIKDKKEGHNYNELIESPEGDEIYGAKGKLAMLDLLLQNERDGMINLDGIREEVDTFLFEGHDTTAMAISFFIMRIANEPEAQDKIFEEIKRILGDSSRTPTIEDLSEMKYLECCIKESLRLYPSVPFITRYLANEVKLSNYKVPPKTTCQIHIFDLHRCPKLYPNPEKFIPERFMPENISRRHPYAYIPFSAGPRNCIGQKFAMLEMKALISTLLRSYRIEPITRPEDVVFKADIVLRTNHPIYARFCSRN